MILPIFAKKITVLHKNGFRTDYRCVTGFNVLHDYETLGPYLSIKGESTDSFGSPQTVIDKLPIKDLHMTIIDWYIPND